MSVVFLVAVFLNIYRNLDNFKSQSLEIIHDNCWKVYNICMKIISFIGISNRPIFWLIPEGNEEYS